MDYAGTSPNANAVSRSFAWSGALFRGVSHLLSRVDADPFPDLSGPPTLFVANHASVADIFYSVAAFSKWNCPAHCLVRHTYFNNRLLGAWLRRLEMVPAGGGGTDAVSAAVALLAAGEPVAMMPEGRITPAERRLEDGLGEFRDGFITIARQANAQIIPITIQGSDQVWGSRAKLPRFPFGRPRVRLQVGPPITIDDLSDHDAEAAIRTQMATMLALPGLADPRSSPNASRLNLGR